MRYLEKIVRKISKNQLQEFDRIERVRSFIPHLSIIRKIKVEMNKFYNAIQIYKRKNTEHRNFFSFLVSTGHFDREWKKIILLVTICFLKLYYLEAILLRWSYMITLASFPLVSFSLPYYHERHAWTVKIRCKKIIKKKEEERRIGRLRSMHHRSHQRFVETEMNRYGGDLGGWIGVNWIPAVVVG